VLPQNIDDDREARTEPARGRGTFVHAYLENVKLIGRDAALAKAAEDPAAEEEWLYLLKALDLDNLPVHLSTEVAFGYHLETGVVRELGRNLNRNYDGIPNPPAWPEIPITLDVIGVQEMNGVMRGYVGDYKTGWTRYPAPDKYGQTLLGALCVASLWGCDEVVVELIYIDEDGDHRSVRRTVDAWDLQIIAHSFAQVPGQIDDEEIALKHGLPMTTHEGAHCDHCAAFKLCPAKLSLARTIPAELVRFGATPAVDDKGVEIIGLAPGVITRENAGEIFVAVERVQAFLGLVKTEICNLGWHEPVPLPDGRVIEPARTSRRELDGLKAAAYLERKYGREEAIAAMDIKVTMEALRKTIVKHKGLKEKITTKRGDGVLDLAIAELEEAGAIALNTSETCKPRMPRRRG
jgi:hypothetical protein